ncbi:MAG: undecaprenyl-phosphate glucose phosphotransferase [Methylophilaceae bacterium 17-44-8]|jgi:putative colanic acid biosynthesis UDP-glucose lipid carrier transferase|nr:MAG: undecaprenyl-phosphate glucose phosphotransferase [Methylophilales bacterium 28-44-11]OYZ07559.1 MAG: undecaprenyl-phosphate glucose phosphotransferase [Methylophilales bacterium 16-45-7]OZA06548.1 MAG: undecaprenyl-phosphate glucose phosphotransferase [Methylophilaceae bacterium 17-44-8]
MKNKSQQLVYSKELTLQSLVKMLADPVLMITSLVMLSVYFGETLDEKYYLIAMLIFAISFPGAWYKHNSIWQQFMGILTDWFFIVAVILFFGYSTSYLDIFPRNMITYWVLITPILILIVHIAVDSYLNSNIYRDSVTRNAVIVGVGNLGMQLRDRMKSDLELGLQFKGFFDDRDLSRTTLEDHNSLQMMGRINELSDYVRKNGIDIIYIALPMTSQPRVLDLLDSLKDTTVSIYFVPDIFVFDLIQARIDDVGGIPVVAVCETPFSGFNGFIKRGSDILLTMIILVLISPLILAVAIGVKMTSKGPILFKQRRYGLDAEQILVYKFRSMTVEENGETVTQATKNDVRITPFGRFIRRTSLDELPQFINVLQGRMSIVGPRPHAVAHNEMYRKVIKGYMIRHKVKPGITGWAQVNGLRGETDTVDKMEARIEYDLDYLRSWSLGFDLKIIVRTVLLVFKDRNAY